jgi:hypothetical protein
MRRNASVAVVAGLAILLFSGIVLADAGGFFQELGSGYGRATTYQIGLGDLDGDGDLDAVFANQGIHDSRVLLNDGTGFFAYTDQRLTRQGHGVGIGDLDADGDLDLFITCAHYSNRGKPSRVYFNNGTAMFTESEQDIGDTNVSGNSVQLVDIEGDGDLDAYVAYMTVPDGAFISRLYLNDGHGLFAPFGEDLPFWATLVDLDLDGDVDALVQDSGVGYRVMTNDGTGGLEETWRLEDTEAKFGKSDAVVADLDGDGDLDILDTNGTWFDPGPSILLRNDGESGYTKAEPDLPTMKAAWLLHADFDGDDHPDLFLSLIADNDQLWLGDGTGGFTDSGVRLGKDHSRGAAAGDLDGDGDLDVFVPVYGFAGGPNRVWENVSGE